MPATITIDVDGETVDGPAVVWHRGGFLNFPTEHEALAFVARRLADRPSTQVEVRVR